MAGGKRGLGAFFRFLCQFQPGALPSVSVAGFDILHGAGDIENISSTLLRLGDQPQRVAAEWMVGKKKIEHESSADLFNRHDLLHAPITPSSVVYQKFVE